MMERKHSRHPMSSSSGSTSKHGCLMGNQDRNKIQKTIQAP